MTATMAPPAKKKSPDKAPFSWPTFGVSVLVATVTLAVAVVVGVLAAHYPQNARGGAGRDDNLIASFRTSSGAEQTFQAAACDIVIQPGSTVVRTPRGFVYDANKGSYQRYNMYVFTAFNNGDGTYGLVSVRPLNADDQLATLDDQSAC